MIGYDIYDCFTVEHFRLPSKNDLDDQNLLLATVNKLLKNFFDAFPVRDLQKGTDLTFDLDLLFKMENGKSMKIASIWSYLS
jgi:hypothetical protein